MSDFSYSTFDKSGALTLVKNALTAVNRGETTVGIRAKNGIVIAGEKRLASALIDEESFHKVDMLSEYMGVAYSGLGPDYNQILLKARKDIQVYHARYQDRMTPYMLCKQVGDVL